MKKVFVFLLIPLLYVSCTNQSGKQAENQDTTAQQEVAELSIKELLADAETFLGKEVRIKGTVDHVCKHGGKKMFVFGESPEDKIKIIPDKNMTSFEVELEGSDIEVQGILIEELKVDEDYLARKRAELKSSQAEANAEELEGEMKQLAQLKEQLDACGEETLSFYVIECSDFKEKK